MGIGIREVSTRKVQHPWGKRWGKMAAGWGQTRPAAPAPNPLSDVDRTFAWGLRWTARLRRRCVLNHDTGLVGGVYWKSRWACRLWCWRRSEGLGGGRPPLRSVFKDESQTRLTPAAGEVLPRQEIFPAALTHKVRM